MPGGWSRNEVEATVADYFRMLQLELAGQKYNKTEHRSRLLPLLNGRSPSAVELKHQNISAVLVDLGWPFISGYKPARNYQHLLFDVVADQIGRIPDLDRIAAAAADMPASPPSAVGFESVLVEAPRLRILKAPVAAPQSNRRFAAAKRDYVAREARNSSLGKAGEDFVVRYERWRLIRSGLDEFADKVEHVSASKGDGLGFDVLSFERDGRERLIEVKTTAFAKETPFFLTQTELDRSRADTDLFHLYRVFEFREEPRLFTLRGAVDQYCILDPQSYRARFA